MKVTVRITHPDGTTEDHTFNDWISAETYGEGYFDAMDSSDARETSIEIFSGNTSQVF